MKVSEFFDYSKPNHVCSHDMFGTCRRGDQCRHTHIEKTRPINDLIYHIKDPSKLINRTSLIEQLNKKFKGNSKYYITTCTFKLQGHSCRNECQGRKDKITLKYKGKDLTIDICYSNINKKTNRIMVALHIDVEYTIKNNRLIRECVIPYKSPCDDEEEEEVKEDVKDIYFPGIGEDSSKPIKSTITKVKEDPKWNIIETPKKEEKKIVIIETKKNEVKDLKLDMSADVGPIIKIPMYTMPEQDTYYRLSEPVLYTDYERELVLDRMASIIAY